MIWHGSFMKPFILPAQVALARLSLISRKISSFPLAPYQGPKKIAHPTYRPQLKGDQGDIRKAVEIIAGAKRPVFYTGGGVINSGTAASQLLRELVKMTDIPVTSTLMGLGAFPASGKQWLGMLGMHGTYEANLAMHDCDVSIF